MIAKILDLLSLLKCNDTYKNISLAKGKNELPKNFINLFNKLKK